MKEIIENTTLLTIEKPTKVSKELPVFYNPVMKLNRDITVEILNAISNDALKIGLPLSGSGVRGIRILKEVDDEKIAEIHFNDYDKTSVKKIKQNLKVNKIKNKKVVVHNKDALQFFVDSLGFDYIDLDPFGTPNPFLDLACRKISRNGVLAVTATDTSAFAGTYPLACKRKYFATPMRNELMHEIGLRIMIRKVQLIGAQYDKALTPIFSYSKDHYYRVFFRCQKGKKKVDALLKQHHYLLYHPKDGSFEISEYNLKKDHEYAGPLWIGKMWNEKLVKKMNLYSLKEIADESLIDQVGIYDIHVLSSKQKLKDIPKLDVLMDAIRKKGHAVSRTHVCKTALRSTIGFKELIRILKKLGK